MLVHTPPGATFWPAAMIVWGPGFTSAPHAHHCVQLVMALRGGLLVRAGPDDSWRQTGAILVRPDAMHAVDAQDNPVLIGFFDAEAEPGAALCDGIAGGIALVDAGLVQRWRDALGTPITRESVERWLNDLLLHRAKAPALDPRVERALAYLRAHLGASEALSLPKLAAMAGLSRSRFMHVFTASVGVPLRPYIRWLRLQRAACELMDGCSVSMAAHRAGFADAAHLTRTFRRMLGTTPSDIAVRAHLARGVAMPIDRSA